ncbi:MAG: TIGR02680 family protein [Lachnospiraceae bacterium]|nr:TIGR02680 family protein [Lachnospiraceae bacterium]
MDRWQINRVGLLNFWYYQNQIFQLADGKMLLRGSNGSGKSLTMQSLFPVLFDGITSAYRLDSFGSRDRTMEDYLLGEKGVSDRDEGTGYLFCEFKKENREEYHTVGIGMRARRGERLNKWFFAIEDNSRIGIDFELFDSPRKDEMNPFTKMVLKNRMIGKGRVFEQQREYKAYVNSNFFGFESVEQFEGLINLMMNLRSPKLSKEFRPSVIYSILRDSLPKLKEDDLYTLSKTIEQLDGYRERLGTLQNEIDELTRFSNLYLKWHQEYTGQIAKKWLMLKKEKRINEGRCSELSEKIDTNLSQVKVWEEEIAQGESRSEVLSEIIIDLSASEGFNLVQKGQELKERIEKLSVDLKSNQKRLESKQKQMENYKIQVEENEILFQEQRRNLLDTIDDNQQYLDVLQMHQLDQAYSEKLKTEIVGTEIDYWKGKAEERKSHFRKVHEQLKQIEVLMSKIQTLEKEAGDIQQELDGYLRDQAHWQQTLSVEIETWKATYDSWYHQAPFYIGEKNYGQLIANVNSLLNAEIDEDRVIEPFTTAKNEALGDLDFARSGLKGKLEQLEGEKSNLVRDMEEWKNKKTPEPFRKANRLKNRQHNNPIQSYQVFYQCIDFLPHVSDQMKDDIEGALDVAGILDALVSPSGLTLEDDVQVTANPQIMGNTLADYLKVDGQLDTSYVELVNGILRTIMVDERMSDHPTIYLDGSYEIANLKGERAQDYHASFIGAKSQEAYRQRMIQELKGQVKIIQGKMDEVNQQIQANQESAKAIQSYYNQRPLGTEVYQAKREIRDLVGVADKANTRLIQKQSTVNGEKQKYQELKLQVQLQVKNDGLKVSTDCYENAIGFADNYKDNLRDAYGFYKSAKQYQQTIATYKEQERILIEEESDFFLLVNDNQADLEKEKALLEENLAQQKLTDVEQLKRRLNTARQEQKDLKLKLVDLRSQKEETVKQTAGAQEQLEKFQEEMGQVVAEERLWYKLFDVEANRYQKVDKDLGEYSKSIARTVDAAVLADIKKREGQEFQFLFDRLASYRPQRNIEQMVELPPETQEQFELFASYNNHDIPVFDYDTQKISCFELLRLITTQLSDLSTLSTKEEQDLFKRIILESVGNILRIKIEEAEKWVEQMNHLLKSQRNSSGLTLSLKWNGVSSQSEEDLGTNKLVELLRKDSKILSDSDRDTIARHFQSKVQFAQERLRDDDDNLTTLFQAISEVLDYRDWFDFELRYKKANEGYAYQPLTDRKFNQFSGGEKAISMYLPLFAAIYSRYQDAGDACPKVITLDEAFAGIDDLNIAELFKACEQLGFNYVMNSQALYGEYETVSGLMTYELIRPQNMNLVTAIAYHWDGKVKTRMLTL